MKHRLDPLLRPRSVAVLGASARADSLGEWSLKNLLRGGFRGDIYPVNPRYDELQGLRCYAGLEELPEVPDLVIFGVGDGRIEATLEQAISVGVPAALIMSALVVEEDEAPLLKARVKQKTDSAGMLVCGANCMGFYNVRDYVWACGFDSRLHEAPGNVSLISHSGSGLCGIIDCDERLRINVGISSGNELNVTMGEYLDFVLDLPETRVVGLFIETARNPDGFRAALDKASQRKIPIVALKVGRTDAAARLTVSHSGAMAGDDATYDALFDRYGVQRVGDMDELATTLILFAEMHPVACGGLVALHDSGGEQQLMVDLADEAGVPLTKLSDETVAALDRVIDPELPAVNPLDGWSRGGADAPDKMAKSLSIMMRDPGAALGVVVHDRGPNSLVYPSYLGRMQKGRAASGKPVALVAARQGTGADQAVVTSTHAGLPVLDGLSQFLRGVRALFDYRDYLSREAADIPSADAVAVKRWRKRLITGGTLGEADALAMLGEFDMPVARALTVSSRDDMRASANSFSYPVVMKTAMPGILHKSECNGVILNIRDETGLFEAYDDLAARLGPSVLIAPMIENGIEMILGARQDPQFGPVIILGFGGVLAETINDVVFALPPFGAEDARRCIDRLKMRPLLDGVRGQAPADIDSYCDTAARFSVAIHALRDVISEIDVNPLIVHAAGCIGVDALVVGREPPGN